MLKQLELAQEFQTAAGVGPAVDAASSGYSQLLLCLPFLAREEAAVSASIKTSIAAFYCSCFCASEGGDVGPAVDAASSGCSQLLLLLRLLVSAKEEAPVSASSSHLLHNERHPATVTSRSCRAAADGCSVLGPPFRVAHKLEAATHVVAAPMTVCANDAGRGR
ncbi:hypothetical protein M9H77_35588 [Catharanthus roseus]|uniref:Uncharacterized protein n=1 Tax=Catharanthus roseus TaxID=4058 RepID=A0ACB9ZRC1_CATRO|nr:hypothetical protein M9H77_35588 [Catharanthus roseus]